MKKNFPPFGAVWEETMAFLRAELALVAPLSLLGFGLPMVALLLAVPSDDAMAGRLAPGPWMLWMLPGGFVAMLGLIAVSALVLTPGISVRESLGLAFRRVPAGLGLFLLYIGLQVVLASLLLLAGMVEGTPGAISSLVYLASLAFMVWVFVRIIPIWAILAQRPQTPWAAVMHAFQLTRSCYLKLLAMQLVTFLAMIVVMFVLLIPIGAVTRLIGMLAGSPNIGMVFAFVAMGVIVAGLIGLWTVYVALLYRRLEGAASSGT